jgi:enoyl-CoA hydratase/carnithine racemase
MVRERPAQRSTTEHITVSDQDGTRTITMSRPETRNFLTEEMCLAMSEAIDSAQSDPVIRCLVLAGRSGVFTSGSASPQAAMYLLQSLENNQKPIVAAVGGPAVGVGTSMVFHCDYVVAAVTATFSSPLAPDGQLAEAPSGLLVPPTLGHQRAFAMLVMGRSMGAEEAHKAGFVNLIVPVGHARVEAQNVARQICELPVQAVAITRKLLKQPAG